MANQMPLGGSSAETHCPQTLQQSGRNSNSPSSLTHSQQDPAHEQASGGLQSLSACEDSSYSFTKDHNSFNAPCSSISLNEHNSKSGTSLQRITSTTGSNLEHSDQNSLSKHTSLEYLDTDSNQAITSKGVATGAFSSTSSTRTSTATSEDPGSTPICSLLPCNLESTDSGQASAKMKPPQIPWEHSIKEWIAKNGVKLHGVRIEELPGGMGKGIVATQDFNENSYNQTMVEVPRSLILNQEYVWKEAKNDEFLQQILDVCKPYSQTDRGAILLFLLLQITKYNEFEQGRADVGPANPWTDYLVYYVASNPNLPTRWNSKERKCLWGTTLERLADRKLETLKAEFVFIIEQTLDIQWCSEVWWTHHDRHNQHDTAMTFADFLYADGVYRSRAMELDQVGNCLVPIMDMANHDSEENYVGTYIFDKETQHAEIGLEFGRYINTSKFPIEVTINYGWHKTPADTLMTYGLVQPRSCAAGLDLYIPEDRQYEIVVRVLQQVLSLPPVCHIRDAGNGNWSFESLFFEVIALTEEDGLEIVVEEGASEVAQDGSNIGSEDADSDLPITLLFRGETVRDASHLLDMMRADEKAEEFQARYLSLVKGFIDYTIEERLTAFQKRGREEQPTGIDDWVWNNCHELRKQELNCLKAVSKFLEASARDNDDADVTYPVKEFSDNSQYSDSGNKTPTYGHNAPTEGSQLGHWQPHEPGTKLGDASWVSGTAGEPSTTDPKPDRPAQFQGLGRVKRMIFNEEEMKGLRRRILADLLASKLQEVDIRGNGDAGGRAIGGEPSQAPNPPTGSSGPSRP